MRKTVNVNIGSLPFTIDEDAYDVLQRYLSQIESNLPSNDTTTMTNIERRIANMFDGRLSDKQQVVDLNMVADAKVMIGAPNSFEESTAQSKNDDFTGLSEEAISEKEDTEDAETAEIVEEQPYNYPKLLYRSRRNRIIAGVCGGLSAYMNIGVHKLRICFIVLLAFGLVSLYIYLLLLIFTPLEPNEATDSK